VEWRDCSSGYQGVLRGLGVPDDWQCVVTYVDRISIYIAKTKMGFRYAEDNEHLGKVNADTIEQAASLAFTACKQRADELSRAFKELEGDDG
jgi:hypothetical protein